LEINRPRNDMMVPSFILPGAPITKAASALGLSIRRR
jgi:hypothetical protein